MSDSRCQKSLNVLVTAFHHAFINISNPYGVGDDESQTQYTHEDICGGETYGKIADTDNHTWDNKGSHLNDNLYTVFEIALTSHLQLQGDGLLVVDSQLEDNEMNQTCHKEHIAIPQVPVPTATRL